LKFRELDWGRHGYGLVLLLVVASTAFQLSVSGTDAARFVVIVVQAVTLVAAVRTTGTHHTGVRAAALVAALIVVTSFLHWIIGGDIPVAPTAVVNGLLVAVAPAVLASGLVRDLRATGEVAIHSLAGVLAIYLLLGMFFAFAYGLIDAIDPEALFAEANHSTSSERLYFSFVTLSTVGYGDLAPASDGSRALAVAEMLIGQIYLVTVVALIVANLGPRRRAG